MLIFRCRKPTAELIQKELILASVEQISGLDVITLTNSPIVRPSLCQPHLPAEFLQLSRMKDNIIEVFS
jgi:hypothetical protein